jgi:uncharacterized membrane protein YfcA
VLGAADLVLLLAAGVAAGAVNSVAGGGSLISFPALLAVGYPSVTANVTNAVAVLPGYLGGTVAYRRELRGQRRTVVALSVTTAVGALCGAILLLTTSERAFDRIVPWLVLFSCALLAAQPLIARYLEPVAHGQRGPSLRVHAMTFASAVYGGYFGAGLGIMLLAVLTLGIADDLQRLNALKGVLSLVVGLVAALFFALFGPVAWLAAIVTAAGALVGGHAGVAVARRLSPGVLRAGVVLFGTAVGVWLLVS